jgi:erythromycin esterase-like protein
MEIIIPECDGQKSKKVVWPLAAEVDLREKYRWYARERRLSELGQILSRKYGYKWTVNAIIKKAHRMEL